MFFFIFRNIIFWRSEKYNSKRIKKSYDQIKVSLFGKLFQRKKTLVRLDSIIYKIECETFQQKRFLLYKYLDNK